MHNVNIISLFCVLYFHNYINHFNVLQSKITYSSNLFDINVCMCNNVMCNVMVNGFSVYVVIRKETGVDLRLSQCLL
jgi:hypothetical protein